MKTNNRAPPFIGCQGPFPDSGKMAYLSSSRTSLRDKSRQQDLARRERSEFEPRTAKMSIDMCSRFIGRP